MRLLICCAVATSPACQALCISAICRGAIFEVTEMALGKMGKRGGILPESWAKPPPSAFVMRGGQPVSVVAS